MSDQVATIRKTIALAKAQEKNTGHLESLLRKAIPTLHSAIEIPCEGEHEVQTLLDFVIRYISQVPNFIEVVSTLTREAGIDSYATTFLNVAIDYFLKPPEIVSDQSGLDVLMGEAYLAHRLMEEVNDRVIGRCGVPLAPMDMTRANLIVHYLIGEPFANELDLVVQYSTELLIKKESVFEDPPFLKYIEKHKSTGWLDELKRWPCLATDLAINLNFDHTTTPQDIH